MKFFVFPFNRRSNDLLMPVLTIAVVISLILVAIGSFNTAKISQGFRQNITTSFQLQRLSGKMVHLDEVRTMSARMAAATGNPSWEERYLAFKPILTDSIEQAIALSPQTYELNAEQIEQANQQLLRMEKAAFEKVRQSQADESLALLFSDSYKAQKETYAAGMQQWSNKLENIIAGDLSRYGNGLFWASVFSMTSFWVLTLAWIVLLKMVSQYIERRQQAEASLHRAKQQLEVSHQEVQASEAALQQKAKKLEYTLKELQQAQVQIVQSEKMSSLGQLVAGVAHEINNPVNFIHANLEPVREYATDLLRLVSSYHSHYPMPAPELQAEIEEADLEFIQADLPKVLSSMKTGTSRIRQIVLSLRNFSRLDETGLKTVELREGIESTLLILQHRLKAKPDCKAIEVLCEFAPLPPVECYPGPLNQVLMNLFSNAIDAIDEADETTDNEAEANESEAKCGESSLLTRGCLKVKTKGLDVAGEPWVEIAIADTGNGIPSEIQSQIFDTFFTTKPVGQGTGMGLSISYSIITDKHNGRLTFTSTPGEGSEFVIQLPVTQLETQGTKSSNGHQPLSAQIEAPKADAVV